MSPMPHHGPTKATNTRQTAMNSATRPTIPRTDMRPSPCTSTRTRRIISHFLHTPIGDFRTDPGREMTR